MGKARSTTLVTLPLVRSKLPAATVESEAGHGITWATPTTSVMLERRVGKIFVQTMNADMTAFLPPTTEFSADTSPAQIAAHILARLAGDWPAGAQLQPVPVPQSGAICGTPGRPGIDTLLLSTFQRIEEVHYWLRDHRGPHEIVNNDPETAMLQQYLVYLSMLVDNAAASLICLAIHGLDPGVIVQGRLLAEYSVRSHYAVRHPDYTLWATTVDEAEDLRKRLEAGKADPALIATVTAQRDAAIARDPQLAQLGKDSKWAKLTVKAMFEEIATTEQHVSQYKYPSSFIHADAVGMRTMFQTRPDGSLESVNRLSNQVLNANLVDAAMMMVEFLKAFRVTFAPLANDPEADHRIAEIDRECLIHSLRFPEGRPAAYLEETRKELGLL